MELVVKYILVGVTILALANMFISGLLPDRFRPKTIWLKLFHYSLIITAIISCFSIVLIPEPTVWQAFFCASLALILVIIKPLLYLPAIRAL